MFKKIKKIGSVVLGLSVIGIVSVGLHSSFTYQAGHADTPAPQRPDLALNIGDTPAPTDNGGDTPAPAYDHGRPPLMYQHGNGGGAPAKNLGDTWSSSYAHGNTGIVSNEADGDTGSPADNRGDGGISKLEEHGETI
ncbi:Phr family secreted Rap phosphatase inhibitor [Bacillus pseudomycoides]|uniref:Phr family secreted Rap phosphatase inhibitor n=1 Tax=Bacillus pseudomycoides TaxID=64104 RepID=UPI000BEFE68E|nr:Phr family secreted Rap phosphatase inhibitor [Bacillus pseudomycoides]PEK60777.1 hypothetical protein CN593_27855 [Bacillus pseudomycoides]PFY53603.1 hypothetical protein COL49_25950 [Bacillus pseudomycoides]PGE20452.1 hypothetical protein COM57_29485 [Bacillus pseudomycoides]